MVKALGLMKIEREAEAALVALINSAPNARAGGVVRHIQRDGRQIDLVLEAWVNDRPTSLICEIKAAGAASSRTAPASCCRPSGPIREV